jgi:DNA-binding MarR family transcriptional regulator
MRMNELSSALGVVPRTVTTIVDALENEGLLARLPDPADRRATLLEITPQGLHQLSQSDKLHEATASEVFDVLSSNERNQLNRLLRHLQAAVDVEADQSPAAQPDHTNPLSHGR